MFGYQVQYKIWVVLAIVIGTNTPMRYSFTRMINGTYKCTLSSLTVAQKRTKSPSRSDILIVSKKFGKNITKTHQKLSRIHFFAVMSLRSCHTNLAIYLVASTPLMSKSFECRYFRIPSKSIDVCLVCSRLATSFSNQFGILTLIL